MGSFGIPEGNITGRGKKKKNTQRICTYRNCQQRSSPDARVLHQQAGAGQGGAAA